MKIFPVLENVGWFALQFSFSGPPVVDEFISVFNGLNYLVQIYVPVRP